MKTVTAFFIVFTIFISQAHAYTYDGDFDPQILFTYEPMMVQQLSPITALIAIRAKEKRDCMPQYAVVCAMRVPGGLVILAYAYYDDKGNFRHFILEEGHYKEKPFNKDIEAEAKLEKHLKEILNTFRQVQDA